MLRENGFYKGVNLGGWLSQCDYSSERLDHFITEDDFGVIASWGADHVRLPVDYNVLENEDGTFRKDGFDRIETAIARAEKNGMKLVLDLHKTAGFSFDFGERESGFFENEALQERFYRLWEELAKAFGGRPDLVAFELLNEVTEQRFIDAWNRISAACIGRLRAYAPQTLVLVGSYKNNSPETLPELAAPCDGRVVYNFHCYSPLKFTHQGADWTDEIVPQERYAFDEMDITEAYFETLFSGALQKAAQHGTGLYCGEYGVIDRVSPEDTLRWYQTIHRVFEKHKIARSAWTYKEMDFGLSDARLAGVRSELLRCL